MKLLSALLLISVVSISPQLSAFGQSTEIHLWSDAAPLAAGKESKDIPTVIVSKPKSESKTARAALVICPGGGYGTLAMDHEGKQIAEWANSMDMVAVICNYRHRGKGYGHPAPLMDAQRAIRFTRAHGEEWGVDPERVGILGFSAGGHLVSTVLTHTQAIKADGTFTSAEELKTISDAVDRQSSKPAFGILCYPVVGMGVDFTHKGSEKNLFGENPSKELLTQYNNYEQVTSDTPPTFLFHTYEDTAVPPRNSVEFFAALIRHGVKDCEIHVFAKGVHGVGLGKSINGTKEWSGLAKNWLQNINVIKVSE
jgi:acetyl esterase/lipase